MMLIAYLRLIIFSLIFMFAHVSVAELRFVTGEEPPTNYVKDGELAGTTVDIVKALKKSMSNASNIEFMPWARAMHIAERESNIMIFTAGRTQARIDHGFQFVGPVITRKHQLWKLKGRKLIINSDQDVVDGDYVIGGMREDWRSKKFRALKANIVVTRDHAQNLHKLMRERVDLWISSDIEAPVISRQFDIDFSSIEPAYTFKEAPSYLMFSKDTPASVVETWEVAFNKLYETDFFEQASKKWSQELGYPVSYSKDTGFFIVQ